MQSRLARIEGAMGAFSLQEGWRRFSGPMHAALDAAAVSAKADDTPGALGHPGAAMGRCNDCHVTFRIDEEQP